MPLRTSWRDIGRLLLYGLLCAAAFFGAALIHWFVIPGLPISPAARSLLDYLLILPLMVLVHLFWKYALEKATPILTAAQSAPYSKPAVLRHCR
jgi:hypothetical protein